MDIGAEYKSMTYYVCSTDSTQYIIAAFKKQWMMQSLFPEVSVKHAYKKYTKL